ncbi:hypothetical protein [Streptomyces sp. NPDC003077]|uniref:hypothetical protein n=1 Tax=Streptomyces sp. NPDC003077 TaxID=3154443 RepID=UPI0033A4956C
MATEQQVTRTPGAPDVKRLVRRGWARFITSLFLRTLIIAALFLLALAASWRSVRDVPLVEVYSAIAILLTILGIYRYVRASRLVQCARVLREYPLEFRERISWKAAKDEKDGKVFMLVIIDEVLPRPFRVRAVNALGRRYWTRGGQDGVWVAGDLAFGGVLVLPATHELLLIQPAKWERYAEERTEAGDERVARAEQAGLTQKVF